MSAPRSGVRVKVRKNEAPTAEPKLLVVPEDIDEFLRQASKKLGIEAKFAYSASGGVIDDPSVLRDDEDVFVSEKAGFWKNENHRRMRIAVLGPGGVGKSCLTLRFTKSTFVESYDPTIEDAFRHQTLIDDQPAVMEILDTAGQEEFRCLSQSWVENKDGFMLIFNLADAATLQSAAAYYKLITKEYEGKGGRPPIVLVGNKSDMARQVRPDQGWERAAAWKCEYIETSARLGTNVDQAFTMLIRMIRKVKDQEPPNDAALQGPSSSSPASAPARPPQKAAGCVLV